MHWVTAWGWLMGIKTVSHSSCRSVTWLFPKLKENLKGSHFEDEGGCDKVFGDLKNFKNMEKTNFDISLKNIPLTNKRNYFVKLLQKTEELVRRMRWKAFFFLRGNNLTEKEQEVYGFRSKKTAPFNKNLQEFEKDLLNIINNISFHKKKEKQLPEASRPNSQKHK